MAENNGPCKQWFCLEYLNFGYYEFVSYFSAGHLTVDIRISDFLLFCFDFFVYKSCGDGGGEATIDVDDGNACGTTIEHS
jgi:hypothetical protein